MALTSPVEIARNEHFITFGDPTVVSDGATGTLTAAVGTRTNTADGGGQLVFFWHNDTFLGWNSDREAFKLGISAHGNAAVEVNYVVLRPGDAACCAGGSETVVYRWDGTSLKPNRDPSDQALFGLRVHLTRRGTT